VNGKTDFGILCSNSVGYQIVTNRGMKTKRPILAQHRIHFSYGFLMHTDHTVIKAFSRTAKFFIRKNNFPFEYFLKFGKSNTYSEGVRSGENSVWSINSDSLICAT
jgi:hypothetical protein